MWTFQVPMNQLTPTKRTASCLNSIISLIIIPKPIIYDCDYCVTFCHYFVFIYQPNEIIKLILVLIIECHAWECSIACNN